MAEQKPVEGAGNLDQAGDADGGHDFTAILDGKMAEMESRLSKQLAGAVRRIIADEAKAASSNKADLSAVLDLDGEKLSVGELIAERQTNKAAKFKASLEAELKKRDAIEPELMARAILDEARGLDGDELGRVLDGFCASHPAMIISKMGPGTGGTGEPARGVSVMDNKTVNLKDARQREPYFDRLAAGQS